jgi:type III secretion protein Q
MIAQPQITQSVGVVPNPVSGQPASLSLRRVARESVRYLNQIALQRSALEFAWLSKQWSIRITPVTAPALAFAEIAKIDWGGAEVSVRISRALLETAMREVLQLENIQSVDGEIRAVLVEAAFAGLASAMEAGTRKRFRLIQSHGDFDTPTPELKFDHGGLVGFSLALRDGEFEYECEAWIDDLALGFLASAMRGWQVEAMAIDRWSGLPLNFQITAGWTTISLGAIRRLRINDVILLDECLVGGEEDQVLIRLGERLGIRGSISGSTITINDWLDEIMDETDDFEEFDESEERENTLDSALADHDGLDNIPVRMNFDLGERMMTLAELRSLAPGYVIELGRDIRRAVNIRVNGKKIGEGELVDIDGYIGVSLLSINPPST